MKVSLMLLYLIFEALKTLQNGESIQQKYLFSTSFFNLKRNASERILSDEYVYKMSSWCLENRPNHVILMIKNCHFSLYFVETCISRFLIIDRFWQFKKCNRVIFHFLDGNWTKIWSIRPKTKNFSITFFDLVTFDDVDHKITESLEWCFYVP